MPQPTGWISGYELDERAGSNPAGGANLVRKATMSYQYYLDNKEAIEEALYNAIHSALKDMTLEELKQISWFTVAD